MATRSSRRRTISLSQGQLLTVSLSVGIAVAALLGVFGSADVEETANSSYSIGALTPVPEVSGSRTAVHTVLAIPVFDTAQGTGDRLPYQASWGQSVSWPLRFVLTSEFYSLMRSLFFLVPGLFLCLSAMQTWLPTLSVRRAVLFSVLTSSSFGLFLRQNDWSDHFVQVIGIGAVSMFLMRREFHDESSAMPVTDSMLQLLCLFVAINGVLTGHPGLWPVALFVWIALVLVFVSHARFRRSIVDWVQSQKRFVVITVVASVTSAIVVARDLLSELSAQEWESGRLSRTPGLFSEFAFGGFYGLSDGGSLPEAVRRIASVILATAAMPLFVMFDGVLPQLFRASDFREMPRVEFSGALIVIAVALGMRHVRVSSVRNLVSRLMIWQLLVWLTVVASVLDRIPAVLASSGTWMTLTVVLIINLFITFLLLDSLPHRSQLTRGIAMTNLALIGYWFLIQFGFATFDSPLRVPAQFSSRSAAADALSASEWFGAASMKRDRIVISSTPSFYDFTGFVTNGVPVVAPADPKMRASDQLQSNFAFNFSINSPRFDGMSSDEIDRTLDFLQVRYVLVGEPTRSDAPRPTSRSEGLQSALMDYGGPETLALPQVIYEVYSRSGFSAFVEADANTTSSSVCSVLFEACPVVTESTRVASSLDVRLRQCEQECLWTFRTPSVDRADRLIIPVTYDNVLNVHDASGTQLVTSSVGGFLGVMGRSGIDEGALTVTLDPDVRMLSRVVVSYLNIGVFVVLFGAVLRMRVQSRRRWLRVE